MIIVFTAWVAAIFYKIKCLFPKFNEDFLKREMTTCINGIFILLVFMSHFNQYVRYSVPFDLWYARMIGKVGQLMVTTFLFYSGYGIMESIKQKGKNYILRIPKKRIFGTLYKFIIAVNIFAIMAHYNFPLKRLLLSFIGWSSIGNSNWYIFVILMLYLFVYINFSVFGNDYRKGCVGVLVCTLLYIVIITKYTKVIHCWYDTALCFPVGMFVSLHKEKLIHFFQKRYKAISFLVGGIVLYLCLKNFFVHYHIVSKKGIWIFQNMFYIFAVLLIVYITTNVYIKNEILFWFGNNLFSFYILQRLPMIYLKKAGLANDVYLYFLYSFIISIVLTYSFSKLTQLLDSKFNI